MCLAVSLIFSAGCANVFTTGNVTDETAGGESIELVKSVVAMQDMITEAAAYRDINVADVYEGSVYPGVKEYSFDSAQTFQSFGKNLGEEVVPGDVLVYADAEKILTQIENYQERVDNLNENYQTFVQENNEAIAEAKAWMEYYAKCLENMQENKPTDTTAADYSRRMAAWEQENHSWEGKYGLQEFYVLTYEEEMRQRTELYQLDYDYYNGKLREVQEEYKNTRIVADVAGTVVAAKGTAGAYLAKDKAVIAVSCAGEKYIKISYVNKVDILYGSSEIYAFVNGNRYEVTYVDDGNTEVTTFVVHDGNDVLESGDFANIVIMKRNSRENALTVATSAVYGTNADRYVYVVKDNKAEKVPVKCGASDGIYTEILSGLEEGDLVQLPKVITESPVNTETLTSYLPITTSFGRTGEIFNQNSVEVKNTLSGVNVYFVEFMVSANDYVAEGDPIVRVRVEGDSYDIIALEMEIKRDKERLDDTIADKPEDMSEERAEAFEEQISAERERIAEKEENLAEMRELYSTTMIYASTAGYVTDLKRFSADTLLSSGQTLATIVATDKVYIAFEDTYDMIRFGDEVRASGYQVTRANLGDYGLSSSLQSGSIVYCTFQSDEEMDRFRENHYHNLAQGRRMIIRVDATVTLMENVVTVPKAAVTSKDGALYVNVLQEDGTVVLKSFVGTKYKEGDYWVIDGLTEGTTICWE